MMDEMRKAFEDWAGLHWIDCSKGSHSIYNDASTERAWQAWQAATLAERERCLAAAADDRDWDCFDGSFVANSIAGAIRNP